MIKPNGVYGLKNDCLDCNTDHTIIPTWSLSECVLRSKYQAYRSNSSNIIDFHDSPTTQTRHKSLFLLLIACSHCCFSYLRHGRCWDVGTEPLDQIEVGEFEVEDARIQGLKRAGRFRLSCVLHFDPQITSSHPPTATFKYDSLSRHIPFMDIWMNRSREQNYDSSHMPQLDLGTSQHSTFAASQAPPNILPKKSQREIKEVADINVSRWNIQRVASKWSLGMSGNSVCHLQNIYPRFCWLGSRSTTRSLEIWTNGSSLLPALADAFARLCFVRSITFYLLEHISMCIVIS
jgi:hypothetical protein